jgi:PTH1 family peptidyl-tRNA hydrolase
MYFLVGLGNPGKKYHSTRHNLGFLFLDHLASNLQLNFQYQEKFNAYIAHHSASSVTFVKPNTFMNNSGLSVYKIAEFYNITNSDKSAEYNYPNIAVVHDDLDILFGEHRIQYGRGSAGHNGVQSIINHLHTNRFWRCRIGIQQKPQPLATKQYVLADFSGHELEMLQNQFTQIYPQLLQKLGSQAQ